ncbi:MAG: polyphosphate polymerase domain-containing protein [Anaerolineae bacterium]|nr:polyphosphate polymerase domain-containing protein [Anaerolineae bacterium]HRJ16990.1 polyphosphate polymerase domain-containing protein [Saprospiraceae bacterium]
MLQEHCIPQQDIATTLALQHYAPISLSKMGRVALLNRTDTKYVLSLATLQRIMPQLTEVYAALVVQGKRASHYRTLYFDSADFGLYHRHHAGMLDRYKVRAREYVDSHLAFLEVKHKTNKGRTIKSRMQTPELTDEIGAETAAFLQDTIPFNPAQLEPKLWVEYDRITLVSELRQERVTIDLNLAFSWEDETVGLPQLVIVEVKQDGFSSQSEMIRLLRQNQVQPLGFSKYCLGVTLLFPQMKHNNFKSKLRLVQKLAQGQSHAYRH